MCQEGAHNPSFVYPSFNNVSADMHQCNNSIHMVQVVSKIRRSLKRKRALASFTKGTDRELIESCRGARVFSRGIRAEIFIR